MEVYKVNKAMSDAYGTVSAKAYLELRKTADGRMKQLTEDLESLREDYSLGVDTDGVFSVSYCARCERCGFSFEYTEERRAFTPENDITPRVDI